MHLGNGAITPECGLVALGAAATSTAVAIIFARSRLRESNSAYTAAALGAAVFAAQMFNVQILPFSSVHLIGGVLLAWTLGAPLGVLLMTTILAIEAAVLGDGGFMALGVNVINMAIVPALFVMAARRFAKRGGTARTIAAIAAASFLATLTAAGLVVLEVAIGRGAAQLGWLSQFAGSMLATHAAFGVLEAIATVAIVGALGGLGRSAGAPLQLPRAWNAGVAGAALLIAVLSVPSFGFNSAVPDGYEHSVATAEQAGLPSGALISAEQAGRVNASVQAWQDNLVAKFPGSELARAATSTFIAGAIAFGMALSCSTRRRAVV